MDATDHDLLAAFLAERSEAALAELLARHGAMVLGTCRRITGDRHDAEEAAQAVFLLLSRKAPALREVECLAAWLHRTASFVALRARSASSRRRRVETPLSAGVEPAAAGAEPDDGANERLDAALARLPETYRAPLVMHHLEGRSCEEIAARLGITAPAVAMRLSRGRELLRGRLRSFSAEPFAHAVAATHGSPLMTTASLLHPSPAATALARECARAMRLRLVGLATAGASSLGALVIAVTLVARLASAEAEPPRVAPPAAATAIVRPAPISALLSEPWRARLSAALMRPVTLSADGVDPVRLLRAIGDQCGLPTAVDLPSERTAPPPVSLHVDSAPLEETLDRIAEAASLQWTLRSGVVLWSERKPGAGSGDLELRLYRIETLVSDPSAIVDDIRLHAGVDWDGEGVGIEQRSGCDYLITQTASAQARIERWLRERLRESPQRWRLRASDPKRATALPAALSEVPPEERKLREALAAPIELALDQPSIRTFLDAFTRTSGVRIELAAEARALDQPLRRYAATAHLVGLEARHLLELALGGTGIDAAMRIDDGGSGCVLVRSGQAPRDGSSPPLVLVDGGQPGTMVERDYAIAPIIAAMPSDPETRPETAEFIEILLKCILPNSWQAEGVAISEHAGAVRIRHTLEAHAEIDALLASYARQVVAGPDPVVPEIPPPLTIDAAACAPDRGF